MAAGLGFKTFTTGEVLTAADTNGYLMQGVLVFASSAARAAAITSPQEGQYSYLKDTNSTEYYDGAAWIAAPIGDITGVTAGTGISGGGTSGTVTITNSMATEIAAKGDLIVGTGAATFDNLTVGANGTTLVADSTASTGLKWATPAGSSLTIAQIASGTMPAASSLSLTGLSSYDTLIVRLDGLTWATNNASIMVTINSDTGANYELVGSYNQTTFSTGYYSTATNYFYAGFGAASQTRTDTDNGRFYVFENCKAAGFTTATVQEKYLSSGGDTPNASSVGIYKSAAAVSSIQFKTSTGNNYTAGNYIIWGG